MKEDDEARPNLSQTFQALVPAGSIILSFAQSRAYLTWIHVLVPSRNLTSNTPSLCPAFLFSIFFSLSRDHLHNVRYKLFIFIASFTQYFFFMLFPTHIYFLHNFLCVFIKLIVYIQMYIIQL